MRVIKGRNNESNYCRCQGGEKGRCCSNREHILITPGTNRGWPSSAFVVGCSWMRTIYYPLPDNSLIIYFFLLPSRIDEIKASPVRPLDG